MTDNRKRAEEISKSCCGNYASCDRDYLRDRIEETLDEAEARGWNASYEEIESLKSQYKAQSAAFKAREAYYNRAEKNLVKERQRLSAERERFGKLMETIGKIATTDSLGNRTSEAVTAYRTLMDIYRLSSQQQEEEK